MDVAPALSKDEAGPDFCIPHRHATENPAQADALLFGRVTYEMLLVGGVTLPWRWRSWD
jgi:hypothetical protein